jgi:hypothetical protein
MKPVVLIILAVFQMQLLAQSSGPKPSAGRTGSVVGHSVAVQWSVQVDNVDPGGVNLEPAFRVAIYEHLVDELARTKRFKQVFRSGDRNASSLADLLILKTTVQTYQPGSETRRAVTTVGGATKLNVRSQLCTPQGEVVLERVVNGNVRFFGGNLRATRNLARNVAGTIKRSTLPEPSPSAVSAERGSVPGAH